MGGGGGGGGNISPITFRPGSLSPGYTVSIVPKYFNSVVQPSFWIHTLFENKICNFSYSYH